MHFGSDYRREQVVPHVNYAFIRPSSLENIRPWHKSKISFHFERVEIHVQIRSY